MTRISAQWRRAPFVLARYRSVLASVLVAAALVAFAGAAAPFLSAAAGSAALKNKLAALDPLATGLEIRSAPYVTSRSAAGVAAAARRSDAGVEALTRGTGSLGARVRTLELRTGTGSAASSAAGGFAEVLPLFRSDALAHVRPLSQVAGAGAWISDVTAQALHVRAGGRVLFTSATAGGPVVNVVIRVRAPTERLRTSRIVPSGRTCAPRSTRRVHDAPVPPPFLFLSRSALFRLQALLGGDQFVSIHELPVDPRRVTLGGARVLERHFAVISAELNARSGTAAAVGCFRPAGWGRRPLR